MTYTINGKEWTADPASVTQQELKDNAISAYAANSAARTADTDAVAVASYWVKRYEELTK